MRYLYLDIFKKHSDKYYDYVYYYLVIKDPINILMIISRNKLYLNLFL